MKKVLNFGSLNLDYVYRVDHFVRPGETAAALDRTVFCGGKGLNQSVALSRAGAETYHAGAVGAADGGVLLETLETNGVDTRGVLRRACPSGHTVIQVDAAGQNCILLYPGANRTLTEDEIERTLTGFGDGDLLVLQNEVNRVEFMIRAAKAHGIAVALNPSPLDGRLSKGVMALCDYLLLNEVEAGDLCGGGEPPRLLEQVCAEFPDTSIVLTLGGDGVLFKAPGMASALRHGVYDVPIVDTTAAGDTFTGYFLSAVLTGAPPEEALRRASKAAALAISRPGAASSIPFAAEVDRCDLRLRGGQDAKS